MWKNRKSPIKYLACFYLINLPKGFCSSLRQPFSNATPKSPFDAICDFDFLRKSVFKEPGVIIQLLPHAALIIISNYSNPATDKGGGGFHCENAPAPKTPSGKRFEVLAHVSLAPKINMPSLSVHANRLPNINLFAYNVNWCCSYNTRINSSNWLLLQLKGNLHITHSLGCEAPRSKQGARAHAASICARKRKAAEPSFLRHAAATWWIFGPKAFSNGLIWRALH